MMIVRDIYPYDEFVKPFISEEEDENTSQEPSNPGDIEDSGNSEETQNPSTPDMND